MTVNAVFFSDAKAAGGGWWQRAGALFRLCAWTALRTLAAHV